MVIRIQKVLTNLQNVTWNSQEFQFLLTMKLPWTLVFEHLLKLLLLFQTLQVQGKRSGSCDHAANKNLCLPKSYSKFELPFTDSVNVVEIGIDISDVLRINDKVG